MYRGGVGMSGGGVGCRVCVWDVQPIEIFWLCKEVRPFEAGCGGRAIATIPPLASPHFSGSLRKYT